MKARGRGATATVPAPADGDRQSQIIDAATRIFQERGYDATTIQAIADEVGILKGSLYYYIETKEDLLFKICDDVHRGLLESMEQAASAGDPLERIEGFIKGHVRFCADNMPAIRVFLHDFRALGEERRKEIVKARDDYNRSFRKLIVDGQKSGQIRKDLDVDLAVLAVFGMMNWMYQWYRVGGPKKPESIGSTFASLALEGLKA